MSDEAQKHGAEQTPTETSGAGAVNPVPPKGVDEEAITSAEQEAREIAGEVRERASDLSLRREVTTIGREAEEDANQNLSLLDQKLGHLMQNLDGEDSQIPQGLVKLRRTMDELNPHAKLEDAKNPKGLARLVPKFLRKVPGIGDVLADMAVKYQTVKTQIDGVTNGLRAGCDRLLQDNIELEQLYAKVQQSEAKVRVVAYKGELLWAELEEASSETDDPADQRRMNAIIAKIARRVQDLRTMEQVFQQFYASIEMTTENNQNLIDSAKRTIVVTGNLLTIGLALQAALQRQKQVAGAVKETQEYTSDLLANNAASIRQQTTEIGEMTNNPVLALDKVQSAYDDLMGAMDETEEIRAAGVERARSSITQLKDMSSSMEERVGALRAVNEADDLADDIADDVEA